MGYYNFRGFVRVIAPLVSLLMFYSTYPLYSVKGNVEIFLLIKYLYRISQKVKLKAFKRCLVCKLHKIFSFQVTSCKFFNSVHGESKIMKKKIFISRSVGQLVFSIAL